MFTRLLSTLAAFFSPSSLLALLLSFPTSLLLVLLLVVVAGFLLGSGRSAAACGAGPAQGGLPCLPCLPWLPLLGSLPWLRAQLPPHLLFSQLSSRYGPLFCCYLGPHLTVVVNQQQHAREVLLLRGKDFAGRPRMVTSPSRWGLWAARPKAMMVM